MLAFLNMIPIATPRLRRVALFLLCALAGYTLGGFLLLPAILKSTIASQGEAAMGRPTHLGEVAFNPFTLRLTLRDGQVKARPDELAIEQQDAQPLLSFDELSATVDLSSLWRMAPVINNLVLRDLAVAVTHYGEGRYSISDLLDETDESGPDREADPFPFALYGFEMTNATLVFDDRPRDKRHVISEINLSIPFTSSFEALRDEFTQPAFSAVINGDPVTLEGRTLPFHDSLRTEFRLGAINVDLDQYWSYVPAVTSLELTGGRLSADISLNFERPAAGGISFFVSGGGDLTDVALASPEDGGVFSAQRIAFRLERFSLDDTRLVLTDLSLDKPAVRVIRQEDDQFNWERYFPASGDTGVDAASGEAQPFHAVIRTLTVNSGRVEWTDNAVPGGFSRTVSDIAITAQGVNTGAEPAPFAASLTIGPNPEGSAGTNSRASLTANGRFALSPLSASAAITAAGLTLPDYAPYFVQTLPLVVESGVVGASGTLALDESATLTLRDGSLVLTELRLRAPDADSPAITAERLTLHGIALGTEKRAAKVSGILLESPEVWLRMDEPGRVDLAALFADGDAADPAPANDPAPGNAQEWTVAVDALRLTRGSVILVDATAAPSPHPPATLALTGIELEARSLSTRQDANGDEPLTCELSADWGGGGTIALAAQGSLAPLAANGTITLAGVGLTPANPYLSRFADLALSRGTASSTLALALAEDGRLSLSGNVTVNNAVIVETAGTGGQGGELAGFDALALTGVRFESEPIRLVVEAVNLNGPHGRVEFDEQGRINLLTALRIAQPDPLAETADATDGMTAATPTKEAGADRVATRQAAPAEPGFFETLRIGTVKVEQGLVRFRDASVAPPYATEVKDIRLTLTDIAQTDEARPRVDMRASLGQTPLSAVGVINPVVAPLYSDIAVTLGGLELAPLTPYTLKYLGHPVERGTLYAEVTFKAQDNVLEADNRFHIRQLVLGPRDTRPGAPNVPVRFGLSLLQDANGDVQIDLPIRGRLDDPSFRVGGIVFKAMAGLFTRALTSPFAIIGSLFGGGERNMDTLVFDPGRSELRASALHKLDTVVTALEARPRLTLEVVGVTDPDADRRGLTEILLEHRLKERKYRSLPPSQRAWTTVEEMTIEPEEYEDLLYEAYKAEPDPTGTRPTTFFVADRQPPEVMRHYLENAVAVTEDDLRQLERERAEAVRNHLVERDPAMEKRVALPDRRGARTARTGVPLHRADLGLR